MKRKSVDLKCLRCGGMMGAGTVLEVRRIFSTRRQEVWIEDTGALGDEKFSDLKGRPHFPVTTWRCDRCGMLESYAK